MKWYNRIRLSWKLTAWMLYLCLTVSLSTLVIYLLGFNYNDTTLFILLVVIRYSSFMMCICALYKLVMNVYHFFKRPNFRRALKSLLYILMILYGIAMVFLESFIVVVSAGSQ